MFSSGPRKRQFSTYDSQNVFAHDILKDPDSHSSVPRKCFNSWIGISLIFLITCLIGYQLSPVEVTPKNVFRIQLTNKFTVNAHLNNEESIKRVAFESSGPECIVEDEKHNLYVGLNDGRIMKIGTGMLGEIGHGRVDLVLKINFPGASSTDPNAKSGRPLGMRIRDNTLYVMDAIYGFYSIHLPTRKIEFLLKPSDMKPHMKFPNDFDIASDGRTVYITDSSTQFSINELIYAGLEGKCTGRMIKFDLITRHTLVLVRNLCFPNGIQLSHDEKRIAIAETMQYRIMWYDTLTWRIKQMTNLPALPDNIRKNDRGTYWVGACSPHSPVTDFIQSYPKVVQIALGLLPHSVIKNFHKATHSMLLEVDKYGVVLRSLHDQYGDTIPALSHGTELTDGRVALGSYEADQIILLNLNQVQ